VLFCAARDAFSLHFGKITLQIEKSREAERMGSCEIRVEEVANLIAL
jgi:hypothetical protein